MRLNNKQIQEMREACLEHFWFFSKLFTDPKYYDDDFHTDLCQFMQRHNGNKLVVLPRGFLKTSICSVRYGLWKAVKDSSIRVLIAGNSSSNASKSVRSVRNVVENNSLYSLLFPETIPNFNKTRWSDSCACLKRPEDYPEGTFESAGVGSNIIRRHFDLIIQDDTVAPKKDEMTGEEIMPTMDDIEKAIGFHKLTIPLLVDFNEGSRLVVGTRWASFDLIQYVKDNESFAEYDKPAYDEEGNILYKRVDMDSLDAIKSGLGSYLFSSLYLNKPLPKEFMKFNPDWLKYYEQHELPDSGEVIITIDPADPPTGKSDQCFSAIVSCKHTKFGMYVLRYRRERITERQTINKALDMAKQDGAVKVRIEADRYANLKYGFKDEMARRGEHYIVEEVKTRGRNKEARIIGLTPIAENGCLYIRRNMRELEEEMYSFPRGRFNDILDALAWQLPSHKPPTYHKKVDRKEELGYNEFDFDKIMSSLHGGSRKYPFDYQLSNK